MIKICLNCGNRFNAGSGNARYCDDCKNGKIYTKGHDNEEYGELKVNAVYRYKNKQYAECVCSCGKYCEIRYDSLKDGKVVSCGHVGEKNLFKKENLSGNINKNGIKIIYRKEKKKDNMYIYHCLCTCGKEFDITSNNFSNVISCGHAQNEARKNNIKAAQDEYKKYSVDGTNAITISSSIPSNNTSGIKGVKWDKSRGKWIAEITFKGKNYYLGRYDKIEDAKIIRKIAEENMHKDFLNWFSKEYPVLYEKMNNELDNCSENEKEFKELSEKTGKDSLNYKISAGRKSKIFIEYNGKRKSLSEWCDELGILYPTAHIRYKNGLPPEKIFEKKTRKKFDYTIKEEYDLSLISDEYRYILEQKNSGKTFFEISEELGTIHSNVAKKAKIAISQLRAEDNEFAEKARLKYKEYRKDEKYRERNKNRCREYYKNNLKQERERGRENRKSGGKMKNYQRKILKDLKIIESYLEIEDIENAAECLKSLIENVKNDIRK